MSSVEGGESTLDLFYASSEEIPKLQRPRRATVNRRNLQCGDDSILQANVTLDKGSPSLGAAGRPRSGESALLVVGSSVLVSTPWSIKTGHYISFAPFERELNFQQNPCNISHLILTLVPHYLGKVKRLIYLKNQGMCTL